MENGCLDIPETREATVYSSALIRASLLSVLLSCACDVMPAGYVPQHVLNLSLRLSLQTSEPFARICAGRPSDLAPRRPSARAPCWVVAVRALQLVGLHVSLQLGLLSQ